MKFKVTIKDIPFQNINNFTSTKFLMLKAHFTYSTKLIEINEWSKNKVS